MASQYSFAASPHHEHHVVRARELDKFGILSLLLSTVDTLLYTHRVLLNHPPRT
jgi:hypothetical protein